MIHRSLFGMLCCILCLFSSACTNPPQTTCSDPIGCVHIKASEPIKIGVLQALTGKIAPLGLEQVRGIELAIDARGGTLLGHRIELTTQDTGCTGEGGANAALRVIADPQIVAIFGSTCSGAARTISKAMSDAGLVMISGNNSAPFLTSIGGKAAPDWHPGYFRTASNEESAGKTAALFAYKRLGIRKAAAINDGDIYTKGLTEGFSTMFQSLGGEMVLYTSVNKGDDQMEPYLTAVLNAQAELLFFPLFQPEGNHILIQARSMPRFSDVILMSDGALIERSFIDAVGATATGMYFVGPKISEGPAIELLAEKYRKTYHVPPSTRYYLSAYDASALLFSAIEQVAVKEEGGALLIGRKALREALYATKNFPGVTGKLSCDQFGDCATPVFNVLRLDNPEQGIEGLQANIQFTSPPPQP